ncbi:U32 family peptidase [Halobacteriovorax sp. GB3]|uniref:U32 family peptidase n=1 Tax=Halobacteriovorax sp. GB3 TaxID=2719615 RepID=UPI002362D7A5|nr:U32 family peptidase [Halobacteriovorax sp. GB3]MDD0851854.1 U32 family peptidase [Halobacteriovorax sp. GB3]
MKKEKKSELLLPVGNIDMARAAIHNGADAIYLGMPGFNARGRTVDHSINDLKEIVDLCHLYGVKVHLAFNILIFQNELEKAKETLLKVLPLGIDAFIVQDLGLVQLIKAISPQQVIHASTQMTVTNSEAIELLHDLDIKRFVLGRENSLKEIKEIRGKTQKELEVFVHGALCVAYSGQCFTSESIGGRSANRGQCAQSCRFEYEMIVDGKKKDLIDKNYLVSPQDLCGINELPELIEMGVESFKVEGRLKSPSFVATAAKSYKEVINDQYNPESLKKSIEEMAISYSRGFFSGWLHGVDHQQLVDGSYGSNRGLKLGQVLNKTRNTLIIGSQRNILKGEGLLFTAFENGKKRELGAKVFDVKILNQSKYELSFSKDFDLRKIQVNDTVYLTSSPQLEKETVKSFESRDFWKRIPLSIEFLAEVSKKASLTIQDDLGNTITVLSESPLEEAKSEIDLNKSKKTLSALSQSAYELKEIEIITNKTQPFLNNKELKVLRRKAIEQLNQKRIDRQITFYQDYEIARNREIKSYEKNLSKLNILVREPLQAEKLIEFLATTDKETRQIDSIILDYEFSKFLSGTIELFKEKLSNSDIKCAIATTRILKPKEYHHLNHILRLNPDFVLVRNLGAISYLKKNNPELPLRGDFSLNVANALSANYLLSKGLESLSVSYDLNEAQLLSMLKEGPAENLELTIHQYMPSFHMEHCVFAAFLSNGSSFRDCGKPCEKHKMELKDQFGNSHYIKVDQECRNTMFNATSQSASGLLNTVLPYGLHQFRIEALHESGEELIKKIESYIDFFEDRIEERELMSSINSMEKYGLSTGQLLKNDSYRDKKKGMNKYE